METEKPNFEIQIDKIKEYISDKHATKIMLGFLLSWILFGFLKLFGVFKFSWGWVLAYPVVVCLLLFLLMFPLLIYWMIPDIKKLIKNRNTNKPTDR